MTHELAAPNLRCTGQHKLWSSQNVHPGLTASRIFDGRIGEGEFWQVVRWFGHYSRSLQVAEWMSQAAGELGPLGGVFV